jgi:hypothetical protein
VTVLAKSMPAAAAAERMVAEKKRIVLRGVFFFFLAFSLLQFGVGQSLWGSMSDAVGAESRCCDL